MRAHTGVRSGDLLTWVSLEGGPQMTRATVRLAVALAVAIALVLTGAEVAGTAAAVVSPSAAAPEVAAAPDCSAQQAAYDTAVSQRTAAVAKMRAAKHRVTVTKRRLRHAVAAHQAAKAHKLAKKVRKLQRRVRRLTHRLELARAQVGATALALVTCQHGGGGGGGGGTSSPIQTLCDTGLPEQLCDALGGLAGGDATTPLQQLCDALPQLQPLCAAAADGLPADPAALTELLQPLLDSLGLGGLLGGGGGGPLPSDLTSVQALCDAGLPQTVCDSLAGLANGLPTDLTLAQLCTAVPQAQAICDAADLGAGLPTNRTGLTDLLSPVLDTLGLGGLLGGGGGGPLPSDLTSVQALCDAGLPQTVCDSLAGLANGLPTDLTLAQLCTAVPQAQAICDAADLGAGLPTNLTGLTDLLSPVLDTLGLGGLLGGGGGGPLPSDLTSVQALCDAGVPQLVCTTLAARAGSLQPSALSLTELCTAVPGAQPICDAANGPGGLPSGSALTDLLSPVLDSLGLGGLLGLLGL
ncbi:hypothetical protein [Nocardioides panacisoli]|uniref:Uncharacterized protein n=1 Tax=Nocardioides panacisoli TaxID=627624 RepID=A0ABP7IYC2_9ACTN